MQPPFAGLWAQNAVARSPPKLEARHVGQTGEPSRWLAKGGSYEEEREKKLEGSSVKEGKPGAPEANVGWGSCFEGSGSRPNDATVAAHDLRLVTRFGNAPPRPNVRPRLS